MTAIPGNLQQALANLEDYPSLKSAIDVARLAGAVTKKYPAGAELVEGKEVWDLYTALLVVNLPWFRQEGQNQATPDGALFGIDHAIDALKLGTAARSQLGKKLCNLRTSSLWDTLSELLLAEQVVRGLASHTVEVEYPLDPSMPPPKGKDADVAVVTSTGKVVLIDVVTPQAADYASSASEQIVDWICKKYDSNFSAHCQKFPGSSVAVVVSLIKNEMFYLGYPLKVLNNKVSGLVSAKLDARPGLYLANAGSFRCPSGRLLVFDSIAGYSRSQP